MMKKYSSNNGEQGKSRYQDLLNSVKEEMGPPNEFAKVCGKAKTKPKSRSSTEDEIKNILIPSNCPSLKTSYVNS